MASAGPLARGSSTATCTAAAKTARTAALKAYQRTMPAKRQAFFRAHTDPAARRKFVASQQAKLKALRAAAACVVTPSVVTPPGASIVASVAIPGDGPVAVGLGSVWVDDQEDGQTDSTGMPVARLYRVDPKAGSVTGTIPRAYGDFATVFDGAVWLTWFDGNHLFRVDPGTNTATSTTTGSGDQGPEGLAGAGGQLWVANHHGGNVTLVDPQTSSVTTAIPVAEIGINGVQALATDGSSVWVAYNRAGEVIRIDVATRTVVSRTVMPNVPCGGIAVDSTGVWATAGGCGGGGIMRIDPATNKLAASVQAPGQPIADALAFGSVWVVDASPNELLRIDPASNRIVGRLALPATPDGIDADSGALWVRVRGALLRIAPQP